MVKPFISCVWSHGVWGMQNMHYISSRIQNKIKFHVSQKSHVIQLEATPFCDPWQPFWKKTKALCIKHALCIRPRDLYHFLCACARVTLIEDYLVWAACGARGEKWALGWFMCGPSRRRTGRNFSPLAGDQRASGMRTTRVPERLLPIKINLRVPFDVAPLHMYVSAASFSSFF
jgi:hypothetical protein